MLVEGSNSPGSAGSGLPATDPTTALRAALAAAGMPADRFVFLGFLPRKASERSGLWDRVDALGWTAVALESPQRLEHRRVLRGLGHQVSASRLGRPGSTGDGQVVAFGRAGCEDDLGGRPGAEGRGRCRQLGLTHVPAAGDDDAHLGPLGFRLGLDEPFPEIKEPALPWLYEQANLRKEKNFFETRVTEYQTGGALSWD